MYTDVCPVCKNKFSSANKYMEGDSEMHSYCVSRKFSKRIAKNQSRPARTSTPIQELEYSMPSNFSDSVTDFFYQSWKSGLHSNDTFTGREQQINQWTQANQQQICSATHVVYVNTVIFQPFIPPCPPCFQQVGFRPDGTFGVLPIYWPYNGNFI